MLICVAPNALVGQVVRAHALVVGFLSVLINIESSAVVGRSEEFGRAFWPEIVGQLKPPHLELLGGSRHFSAPTIVCQ